MSNLANFVLFQLAWFACVGAAAEGWMWPGPAAVALVLVVHLRFLVPRAERRRQLAYVLVVGLLGTLLDSVLGTLDLLRYPTSADAWPYPLSPPWIAGLWVLFATLPHHSLRWLAGRPLLALVLGAVAGPLSFLAGTRFGAVGVGAPPLLSWVALSVEYAVVTPLLLHWARRAPAADPARSGTHARASGRPVKE